MSNLVFSHKLRSSALPSITVLISREQVDARCRTCCIDKKREEEEERDKSKTDQRFHEEVLIFFCRDPFSPCCVFRTDLSCI